MSIRTNILYVPNVLLRTRCLPVGLPVDQRLYALVELLKDSIRYRDLVWRGAGYSISAPQIGVLLQVFVISRTTNWKTGNQQRAFDTVINPKILEVSRESEVGWEGCLSVPEYECLVERPVSVNVEYANFFGKIMRKQLGGLYARIFQHEVDHMKGELMIEKALERRLINSHDEHN